MVRSSSRVLRNGMALLARVRVGSTALFAVTFAALLLSGTHHAIRAQAQSSPAAAAQDGSTTTRLADGTELVVGRSQAAAGAALLDPVSGRLTVLSAPHTPRRWHAATLLADGTVLIPGGIDAKGRTVAAPERYVPATQTFESLPEAGFVPRARHTATLLTDGRVLIAGGTDAGRARDDAEIWDPAAQAAEPVGGSMRRPRAGQRATLSADGQVVISGGGSEDSVLSAAADVFNPTTGRFEAGQGNTRESQRLYVTTLLPSNGSVDVPVNATVTVRFSRRIDAASVTPPMVHVRDGQADVPVTLVVAEGGRLLFVHPLAPLDSSTTYDVAIAGLRTADGSTMTGWQSSFQTAGDQQKAEADSGADDGWAPGGPGGWRINGGASPWLSLPPLMAPPGATALSGQVLRLNGTPLADVTLEIDGHEARSDRTGRFLL